MPEFTGHLTKLTGSDGQQNLVEFTEADIEEWERHSNALSPDLEYLSTSTKSETSWTSVLDLGWSTVPDGYVNPIEALYSKLTSNPRIHSLLPSLASLLSSHKTDEEVSGEVADLLGFEEIDLIMEIINNRLPLSYKLAIVDDGLQQPKDNKLQSVKIALKTKGPLATNGAVDFTADDAKRRMESSLRAATLRPLFSAEAPSAPEVLPHVYTSSSLLSHGNILSSFGSKYILPVGTTRETTDDYEEITVPPAKPVPPRTSERIIPLSELDSLVRGSFQSYTSLNRIQSVVYPTAYGTNENLLICAPTGAGKTDVAMLTILRVVEQNLSFSDAKSVPDRLASAIKRDNFKIIYVAPMKALAAEIVRKLGKRLAWLSIRVRELTGDMQLTKSEIAETQIIVTTPEKWDVVTRKPTDEGELASKVKLLIIDEVHLLNEERGAVIETIVSRTLRQVESTQSLIRVVGLSATLPNYVDVADFLRVSRYRGLFYFDSSFRPIPLEQHFLGIKGKSNSPQARRSLDRATYDKVASLVEQGHQVMVFVHSRKDTVKSAQALREAALSEGIIESFSCQEHPTFSLFRRDVGTSRNKEMKELFDYGFGIHHAGMLRSDRNMMERMFEARAIKVLCCTATLAWGVNLPAHAVIIKGTQVYDSSRGTFVDLSVLDVLQIFGRAGRPGMETSGVGFICTSEEKLPHYLDAVTAQHPIESKFIEGMVDSLNAEVSLGTVTNIEEAIQWVGYTYLFVRMRRNPTIYGIAHDELADDPQLGNKRHQLVTVTARRLAAARMVVFNESAGSFTITDLGRIVAKYYIKTASIEIFNKEFRSIMTEADILGLLSMSTEFDQIQLRESEVKELRKIMEEVIPCEVKGGTETSQGKVNILLQAYISRAYIEDFALVSDMAYVAQNSSRIIRGLFEISISRKWANASAVLIAMSKAVEKRIWPFEHPLIQSNISQELLYNLQAWAGELSIPELAAMNAEQLGQLVRLNERHGAALLKAAKRFPTVSLTYILQPLSSDLLKISIHISKSFEWSSPLHGSVEPFWLWIEDHGGEEILQWSHRLLRQNSEDMEVDFVIIIRGSMPPSVNIRLVFDRWMGAEDEVIISFDELIMPTSQDCHTPLLDLLLLPVTAVENLSLRQFYAMRFQSFNSIQTQCFWTLAHTNQNTLICAQTGSGLSTLAIIALWKAVDADRCGLVIVPSRSVAREIESLLKPLSDSTHTHIATIFSADALLSRERGIQISTPQYIMEALERPASRKWVSTLKIVLCENLELLDARYELAVSLLINRTQALRVRYVGLAGCLNDPADLARWLNVDAEAMYNFRVNETARSLSMNIVPFTSSQSAQLLRAMAKPAHAAIRERGAESTALVFVPSRGLCHGVAADLITQCGVDINTRGFLGWEMSTEILQPHLTTLHDGALHNLISHGIGIFHEGMRRADLALILQLYLEGIVRVLIVPREACWTVAVRASTVVVMGTQYTTTSQDGSRLDKQVHDYSPREVARMRACAITPNEPGTFHLFCHAEQREAFMRFLADGLPLESELATMTTSDVARTWLDQQRRSGLIVEKQDAMDAFSFTYFAHRLESNPMYYNFPTPEARRSLSRWLDSIWDASLTK